MGFQYTPDRSTASQTQEVALSAACPYLLHLGVLLDVDLLAAVLLQLHGAHGVQGDVAGQV